MPDDQSGVSIVSALLCEACGQQLVHLCIVHGHWSLNAAWNQGYVISGEWLSQYSILKTFDLEMEMGFSRFQCLHVIILILNQLFINQDYDLMLLLLYLVYIIIGLQSTIYNACPICKKNQMIVLGISLVIINDWSHLLNIWKIWLGSLENLDMGIIWILRNFHFLLVIGTLLHGQQPSPIEAMKISSRKIEKKVFQICLFFKA